MVFPQYPQRAYPARRRAAAGLIDLITQEHRRFTAKPQYGEVLALCDFGPIRTGRVEVTADRYGAYRKGAGYTGYTKSLYAQDWFDSSTERDLANILQDAEGVTCFARLQIGDLPILWTEGRAYNPDFIAITTDGTHWVIEAKMDREMHSAEVRQKREAAMRWANHVTADPATGVN